MSNVALFAVLRTGVITHEIRLILDKPKVYYDTLKIRKKKNLF